MPLQLRCQGAAELPDPKPGNLMRAAAKGCRSRVPGTAPSHQSHPETAPAGAETEPPQPAAEAGHPEPHRRTRAIRKLNRPESKPNRRNRLPKPDPDRCNPAPAPDLRAPATGSTGPKRFAGILPIDCNKPPCFFLRCMCGEIFCILQNVYSKIKFPVLYLMCFNGLKPTRTKLFELCNYFGEVRL